jgi:hypothetical protein
LTATPWTAIEGVDALTNTTIANNTITNAGAGIASYWCTAWRKNAVTDNTVSGGSALMWVLYRTGAGQCSAPSSPEPPFTPAAFTDNQVTGNRYLDPGPTNGIGLNINLRQFPSAVSNNLIANNDIGPDLRLTLDPLAGFVNGGGNICVTDTPFCGGGSDMVARRGSGSIRRARVEAPLKGRSTRRVE